MRLGKIRTPHFRIVVADARTARNGRAIEEIGRYSPVSEPSFIEVNSERAQYWMGVGAQPTEAVEAIFKITGDWQKAKGLPGAEGTLKKVAEKPHKRVAYEAAVKDAMEEPKDGATTLKKKAAEKLAAGAGKDADFYTGKIASAKFFVTTVLPHITADRKIVEATDSAIMDLPESAF